MVLYKMNVRTVYLNRSLDNYKVKFDTPYLVPKASLYKRKRFLFFKYWKMVYSYKFYPHIFTNSFVYSTFSDEKLREHANQVVEKYEDIEVKNSRKG